jgi:hypothetical protein
MKETIKDDLVTVWSHLDGNDEALEAFGRLVGAMLDIGLSVSNDWCWRNAADEVRTAMLEFTAICYCNVQAEAHAYNKAVCS